MVKDKRESPQQIYAGTFTPAKQGGDTMGQYICENCIFNYCCEDCKDSTGKRYNVENCGDFNARLETRQKIRISGSYKDNGDPIFNYVCGVNDMGVRGDDKEIFFYFKNWAEVDAACIKETAGEFIIDDIRAY